MPRKSNDRTWIYAALFAGSFLFFLPFWWMVISSLKTNHQIFTFPPDWFPWPIRWRNYLEALTFIPFLRYLWNTLIISAANTLGNVLSASLVAYSFSR
ncbi:MAG TPA: carbohydrate ABC transporter permease, partial [bacterium]|nr:carbohydrate ABC transporter permease [bacterium]